MRSTLLFFALIVWIGTPASSWSAEKEPAQTAIHLAGEWTGTIPGLRGSGKDVEPIIFDFQVKDGALVGSVIVFRSESAISNGKINKNKFSFKADLHPKNESVEYTFKGEIISDDTIEFEMRGAFINAYSTYIQAVRKKQSN